MMSSATFESYDANYSNSRIFSASMHVHSLGKSIRPRIPFTLIKSGSWLQSSDTFYRFSTWNHAFSAVHITRIFGQLLHVYASYNSFSKPVD